MRSAVDDAESSIHPVPQGGATAVRRSVKELLYSGCVSARERCSSARSMGGCLPLAARLLPRVPLLLCAVGETTPPHTHRLPFDHPKSIFLINFDSGQRITEQTCHGCKEEPNGARRILNTILRRRFWQTRHLPDVCNTKKTR